MSDTMSNRKRSIQDKAFDSATEYYDNVLVRDGLFPKELKDLGPDRDKAIETLTEQFAKPLMEHFKESDWNEAEASILNNTDNKSIYLFAKGQGDGPKVLKLKKDFKDFQDLATDGAWRNLPKEELQWKAMGLGYNLDSPDQSKEFYKNLNDYETYMRKQGIVDDFKYSPEGYIARYAFPSAYEEAVKQALTDAPYDEGKVNELLVSDGLINSAILATPGLGISKFVPGNNMAANLVRRNLLPLSETPVAGLYQGGMEAGKQAAKKLVDPELEFDTGAVAASTVAGATVPSMAMGAQQLMYKAQAPWARQMSRGFARGARGVDQLADERNAIKYSLIRARELGKKEVKSATGTTGPRYSGIGAFDDAGAYGVAEKNLSAMGFEHNPNPTFSIVKEGGPVSTVKPKFNVVEGNLAGAKKGGSELIVTDDGIVIGETSAEPVVSGTRPYYIEDFIGRRPVITSDAGGETVVKVVKPTVEPEVAMRLGYDQPRVFETKGPAQMAFPTDAEIAATQQARQAYESAFPVKVADEKFAQSMLGVSKKPYYIGMGAGQVLGKIGGSVEPAAHFPWLQGKSFKSNQDSYQEQDWYKKLKETNPQAAAAFDAAMKKKKAGK